MQSVKGNGLKRFLKERNDIISNLCRDKQFPQMCWQCWLANARFRKCKISLAAKFQFGNSETRDCLSCPPTPDSALQRFDKQENMTWLKFSEDALARPAMKIQDFVCLCLQKGQLEDKWYQHCHKGHTERLHWKLSNGVLFIFIP